MNKNENEQTATAETATDQTVPVLTRFKRAELEQIKDDTGATADATAVACFVRKNLRKRG
jgi:hypothetical protein